MAVFRSGIRWADMSTESFSRSKTAPGGTAQAALLLQAEQADQSYAPGDVAALPEFENSQAGMNQYFFEAAALGGEDSSKNGNASVHGTGHVAAACSSDKSASSKPSPDEEDGAAGKMPGFRGLLVSAPSDGASAGASDDTSNAGRRERNAACKISEAATLTPAKRNRRTSGAPDGAPNVVAENSEAPAQDGSASAAAQEGVTQRFPQSKRRRSTYSRRSADGYFPERMASNESSVMSHGQQGKRRSAKGNDRHRSGGTRRASEGPSNAGLLLHMGAPAFLQLPGLVSPMFMPVGLPPGTAAPLPGLLHPQAVKKQQAMVNSSKEQQEQEDEEEWHRRECARMKDIAIGKATAGYRNFLKRVGTERRSEGDPMTPDAKLRCSKAQFQRAYQKWRKQLHQYDTVEDEASAGTPSPAEAQPPTTALATADAGADGSPKETSDQQDLEAILAFNKECELAGL
ncbi:uncharacterized protein EMH_0066570 [Eimeria mitis]|uniref:Histone RNA hairpin-binding protein RNA-binding domain-containing protein n=1 Tax=Eimeria mitis TaxID=44415 RepID=U6KEN0_9EIME|nr:uncharacterized protein EMH_0066570 [Eimeria mitis]CDJ34717.1 hypothetical protein, conserved [Eimeria mitis]